MTIQLGVPGAAGGGGGGGATNEIAQAGGRVTVEADGSITIEPDAGADGEVFLKGVLNGSAPLLRWGDDVGVDDITFGVEKVSAANLDDGSAGSAILAVAGTLYIGVRGNPSSFDITGSGVEVKAPRWLVTQPGPHAWGQAFAGNDRQFEFGGQYTGGGFSDELRKLLIAGVLIGDDGDTAKIVGLQLAAEYRTQTAVEDVGLIAAIDIPIATVVDNLTGNILETAGLHIEGPMVGGVDNYAILAPAGLSKIDQIWASGLGPHTFGRNSISALSQFTFGGAYVGSGSDLSKVQIENALTGVAGTQRYRGLHVSVSMATQANSDTIFNMSLLDLVAPNITNNLTGGPGISQAATVRIQGAPTEGNTNFSLIVEAGLSQLEDLILASVGPHAFGVVAVDPSKQFLFGGDVVLTGGAPKKFILQDRVTGSAGASQYAGLEIDIDFTTQIESVEVDVMAAVDIRAPGIVNNLTGGNTVLEGFTVRIQGPPTGADDNWALKVDNGLSEFDDLLLGGGASSLAFFGSSPSAKAAITGSRAGNAALASLLTQLAAKGLITDSSSA